jgi:hypothetical protein
MKFGNPKSQQIQDAAALVAGAVAGGAVSRGVMGIIHKPSGATDDATLKKESNMLLVKRVVLAAAAVYGASAISGNDTAATAVKGSLVGMAVIQVADAVSDIAAKSTNLAITANSTATQKFTAHMLGLKCACSTPVANGMGKPTRRYARLRMPEVLALASTENPYDAIFAAGQQLSA